MAKNANDAQIKSRKTKLSKKTSEELISIILRKDATERRLTNQILNLKNEVNALTSRVDNFDKEKESNLKAIKYWKDSSDSYKAISKDAAANARNFELKYTAANELANKTLKANEELKAACKSYRNLCISLGIGILILAIYCFV